ncbi:MAG: hypothetical protein ABIW48_04155 [Burkholderiales bacterium]|nr:hypothetical protein [Pseudomonadota bacterium]
MNAIKHRFVWFLSVCLLPCAVLADAFTGVWSGTVSEGGESYQFEVTFSRDGYPIFSYTNNKDLTRQLELRSPGQKIQYVPNGGGVQTYVLEEIEKDPVRMVYALRSNFQGASNGYLSENNHRYVVEYVLRGAELHVTIGDQADGYMGDREGNMIGNPSQSVAKGVLKRAQ